MKKVIAVVLVVALALGIGIFVYSSKKPSKSYSMEEIAKHGSREDCWLLIEGKVYDVTSFVPMHKGKDAILMGCGKDATQLFNDRPNGKGAHSSLARNLMKKFAIGELAK